MEHSPASSMHQVRSRRLVALVRPAWLIATGLHVASMIKALILALKGQAGLGETAVGVGSVAAYFFVLSLPMIAIKARRLHLLIPAMAVAHLVRTALFIFAASDLGSTQLAYGRKSAAGLEAVKKLLTLRVELVTELVLGFQDLEMSLPILAVLHGLRQVGWMRILMWRMGATPLQGLIRGTGNWALLMTVSYIFELRTRAAHQRECNSIEEKEKQQQQQQEKPKILPYPAPAIPASEAFVSDLPNPSKPVADASSSSGLGTSWHSISHPAAYHGLTLHSQYMSQPHQTESDVLPGLMAAGLSEPTLSGRGTTQSAAGIHGSRPQTTAAAASRVLGRPSAPAAPTTAPQLQSNPPPAAYADSSRVGSNTSLVRVRRPVAAAIQAQLSPQHPRPFNMLVQIIEQQRNQPYMRNRGRQGTPVHVKIDGLELEHLPPDLPKIMHEQLRHCMPAVALAGLALRSGCVMLTMDLMCPLVEGGARQATLADDTRRLIARLMQDHSMGHVLEVGATMSIQTPNEVALCRWEGLARGYTSAEPVGQASGVPDLLLSCFRMLTATPVIYCLPAAAGNSAPGAASHQLTLTVELELPSNCPLLGWQPDGALGSAGVQPANGVALHAMLLARRLDGGYLPVVVERVSEGVSADGALTRKISTQVVVTLDGVAPAALCLELWCKRRAAPTGEDISTESGPPLDGSKAAPEQAPALELLVSRMPLLVLLSSWKEAAAELQQHILDIGGVQPHHALPTMHVTTGTGSAVGSCMGDCDAGVLNNTQQQHSQSLDDDPELGVGFCLLGDLGALLTRHHRSIDIPGEALATLDSTMSELGDDLLVYAVRRGLGAVAGMIVDTMQRAEQQVPASGSSAWLMRVACNSEETFLLHAAMASGNSDVLARVLRWGMLYGGPDWAWPWELEDEAGCTALHLAAAQPAAGACAALLKTIACMLSASQVQAARRAWFDCQGGVGVTPANLFAAVSDGSSLGDSWSSTDSPGPSQPYNAVPSSACPPDASSTANPAGAMGFDSSTAAAGRPSVAGTSVCGNADLPACSTAATFNRPRSIASRFKPLQVVQSWLSSIVEVWVTPETDEYRAWAKQQMSGLVYCWAFAINLVSLVGWITSSRAGYKLYEVPEVILHGVAYIPTAAATRGATWLGDWQVWMLIVHAFHSVAYVFTAWFMYQKPDIWHVAVANGADIAYVVLLTSILDQARLPQLLIARIVEAFCHGLVNKAAGLSYPILRGFIVHGLALVVTTVARARQLRAYRRWQVAQERSRRAVAQSKVKQQ